MDSFKKQKKVSNDEDRLPSFFSMLRYSTLLDRLLMGFGTAAAVIHGTGMPALFIFFGQLTTKFLYFGKLSACDFDYEKCLHYGYGVAESDWDAFVDKAKEDFFEDALSIVRFIFYVAIVVFVCASIQTSFWSYSAIRQTRKIRLKFFQSVIRQDAAFHDVHSAGELNVHLASDINKIKGGIGEKVACLVHYSSQGISGIIVGIFFAWKLALVTIAIAPLIGTSAACFVMATTRFAKKEIKSYAKAGSIAQETIAAKRTVDAFGIQNVMKERYSENLRRAKIQGLKRGFVTGLSTGFLYFTMYCAYALSFWYGTYLVIEGTIEIGDMLTTFYGILVSAFSLGTCGSFLSAITEARAASISIFKVIDREPDIDIFSPLGEDPITYNTKIVLKNVYFKYPARPDLTVLKGVSITVPHGSRVALVGASGCGKSTIIQLVQRFYDPEGGAIYVGEKDLRQLNLKKYRDIVGVVSQEPVLFETSIVENIRMGREKVTSDEVVSATKEANAYNFIMNLPNKFDTFVGEGGSQMSGGQKQRIAIARAIVRNPKILLLDEATSALDTESESIVQAALDKASEGRTTIVVAHRLSTVRNADLIIAFSDGRVAEQGTHDELMELDGVYANLCRTQNEGQEETESTYNYKFDDSDKDSRRSSLDHGLNLTEQLETDETEEDLPKPSTKRLFALNGPEWYYILMGIFFCIIAGSCDPINAIVFADVLTVFEIVDPDERDRQTTMYCFLFFAIGVAALISNTMEATFFSKSGMELTTRLRIKGFDAILRQDASFFDLPGRTTSILCSRLSSDASKVQGMTGAKLGLIFKSLSSIGVGIGIAFYFSWKLTLMCLCFIPFMIIGKKVEMAMIVGDESENDQEHASSAKIASQAIDNIKTVANMTREHIMYEQYEESLRRSKWEERRKCLFLGLGFGYSMCTIFCICSAVYRFGTELIMNSELSFEEVYKVLMAIVFGGMAAAQASTFAPDFLEAQAAAARMFNLLDMVPSIDSYSTGGVIPDHCKGEITVKSAKFHYPTRPDAPVLKDLSIKADPGESVALVGHSGCGKSTIIQLLQRFYDPVGGQVLLDGIDIRNLNISWLRRQIGIVSQEPVLFNLTLKENILLGDISRTASDEEIRKVAKLANAHDFISKLPNGYDTMAGQKGSQLSGGQKQRIAITRALLRYPKILLLDEATSALDNESEKIVQAALDDARVGRTCLMISHRLSTVRNADKIYVVDNGEVVETGDHEELLALEGSYFGLINAQLYGYYDSRLTMQ